MSDCAIKRSRKDRTVAEKLELMNRYKALPSSLSQRKAAESLGISRGFLQNLLKNEAAIRAEDWDLSPAKRKRAGKDQEVENALFAWFKFAQERNAFINGPILMHKANDIAQAAGDLNFKATNSWFSRWKKRYGLTFCASKVSQSGMKRQKLHDASLVEFGLQEALSAREFGHLDESDVRQNSSSQLANQCNFSLRDRCQETNGDQFLEEHEFHRSMQIGSNDLLTGVISKDVIDEAEQFGRLVAAKLRKLNNPSEAEIKILHVLLEEELTQKDA